MVTGTWLDYALAMGGVWMASKIAMWAGGTNTPPSNGLESLGLFGKEIWDSRLDLMIIVLLQATLSFRI